MARTSAAPPAPALADALFDAAPDPMAHFAADGTLLRANAAFRAVYRQEIGPRRAPWGRVPPPPFVGDIRMVRTAPAGRQPHRRRPRRRRARGSRRRDRARQDASLRHADA
jgi:PAS domain-containing protein